MNGISISTCFNYEISFEKQMKLIHKAGFSHFSIGSNYNHSGILDSGNYSRIKMLSEESSLKIDTVHGYAMDKPDTIEINKKLAQAALVLNVPVIILHCSAFSFNSDSLEDRKKDIIAKLPAFENIAKENNINFAFENVLPGAATDLAEFAVNNSNPEYFGFCYDSSHDQIDGPRSFDLLKRNINRLKAVHISDRIREFVDHLTIGEGFIKFEEIADIIHSENPSFPLLMEVSMEHSKYKNTKELLFEAYKGALDMYNKINAI